MTRFPERLLTERLELRPSRTEDAAALLEAVTASYPELHAWMPWAKDPYGQDEAEAACAAFAAAMAAETEYPVLVTLRNDGRIIGASGLIAIDWRVPKCEIGYWLRTDHTGQGYVTEAVRALARFAFDDLGCRRVEIRMDAGNARSRAVAERLGFAFEATLKADARNNAGKLRDTRIYALFDPRCLR